MKIGIIDIVAYKSNSLSARYFQTATASIMPQIIAVWLEELGHNVYYHVQTTNFTKADLISLPSELDIVFISTYSINAYTAYSLSNYFKSRGVITVLGGSHARSFSYDSIRYFNIVVLLCNKKLIGKLVKLVENKEIDTSQKGVILTSESHFTSNELVPIQSRLKFINIANTRLKHLKFKPVPFLTSLGCNNGCSFCIDSTTKYQVFDNDFVTNQLNYLSNKGNYLILLHDPNLENNIDKFIISSLNNNYYNNNLRFIGELPLSSLTNTRLQLINKSNFIAIGPGLESWNSFSKKSSSKTGLDRVNEVSNQLNIVIDYVPAIQLNLLFGLDSDCRSGNTHFELTKQFITKSPYIYSNFQTLTVFGDSTPLKSRLSNENRLINIPYNMLDGFSISNIVLKQDPIDFYTNYVSLLKHANSVSVLYRRLKRVDNKYVRLYYIMKYFSMKSSIKYFNKLIKSLKKDEAFYNFLTGRSSLVPDYYNNLIRNELDILYPYYNP